MRLSCSISQISLALALTLIACAPVSSTPVRYTLDSYQNVDLCKNCHERAYDEYRISMHSRSYANPVFQAQYFEEVIPRALTEPAMAEEASQCLACHNPIAYMTNESHLIPRDGSEKYDISGTCDFCHTINGIRGKSPGNGNYISSPGPKKYGPHQTKTEWHHVYSPVQDSSEFCGTCHNDNNHTGLEIKSTYTEWKESIYARKDITCQDCHMNVIGFLSESTPIFDKGSAAEGMTLVRPPHRERLHTHTFPGAYSTNQISGAIKLQMRLDKQFAGPGETVRLKVRVDSRRSGHKIPTGSTDLRLLWLEVSVDGKGRKIILNAATSRPDDGGFDVAGMGKWDAEILGDTIPAGSRIYRQIFLDKDGRQTISSFNAVESIFDNRLEAAKTRVEEYSLKAPDAKGSYSITAKLKYLAYPPSFTRKFKVADGKAIEVASTTKELKVE